MTKTKHIDITFMYLGCMIIPILEFLGEILLTAYIFIFLVKLIAILKIRRFCGTYSHESPTSPGTTEIRFVVSIKGITTYLLSPIQNISLHIERTGDVGDWSSKLTSDILNIHHFQGTYYIRQKPEGGKDGWFDAYLFVTPNPKIALHLHYLENNRWDEDEGYYINKLPKNNIHSSSK